MLVNFFPNATIYTYATTYKLHREIISLSLYIRHYIIHIGLHI